MSIVTTGSPSSTGLPCAMVLTAASCSPRRSGFLVTVACGLLPANLTPASRRQDHTTSPSAKLALSSAAPPASTTSRPASVTIAIRPSVGRDGGSSRGDLGEKGNGIFLQTDLDR